ncbi:MAG TPA: FAD-dependent oxidoreductase [Pyrinomonadaceae bacterium]|nr:FAD-dependent oxidoreductase [Pyrinomonadaceae bacterium]
MNAEQTYDTAVIGAGVFGAWTAYRLRESGQSVALLDGYGPANSRASSGGESRIIRMGYGADEVYTHWAARSLALWRDFFRKVNRPLFQRTGVLWLARDEDPYTLATLGTLSKVGVKFERLTPAELEGRFPQFTLGPEAWGVFEPDSGVILARSAVQEVVREAVARGVTYLPETVVAPDGRGRLDSVKTRSGLKLSAANFVFACGPWLPKIFPRLLGEWIRPTRQEVFFFGVGAGDPSFTAPAMPAWVDFGELVYGVPDLEGRGFKLAIDAHGPPFDPDSGERLATAEGLASAREHLARILPGLRDAPVVETRVCQYENTPHGDFLIDRHPDFDNVWLVGGGSGHGFKHGPALGEYVAGRVTRADADSEPRFALSAEGEVRRRLVY